MFGIICNDKVVDISLFTNYREALRLYFNEQFKDVKCIGDLNDITHLFIVDEHFNPNVQVWKWDNFIDTINSNNIKVIVFNFEKIYSSKFPWNVDHQNKLQQIKKLVQFVSDVDDCCRMGRFVITKQLLSNTLSIKHTFFNTPKKDRILFLGSNDKIFNPSYSYSRRFQLLQELSKKDYPLDICVTDRKFTYSEFIKKLSEYKYILNPLGTGNFLNVRFYEALEVGCIPIQQVTNEMLSFYSELKYAHTFTGADDFTVPEMDYTYKNYYLEDYFEEINLQNFVY